MNPEIVQTQSCRYKTIVVIKRQQQTTISNKLHFERTTGRSTKLFLTTPWLVCLAPAFTYLH